MPGLDHMLPGDCSSAEQTDLVVYVMERFCKHHLPLVEGSAVIRRARSANQLNDVDHELHTVPVSNASMMMYDKLKANVRRAYGKEDCIEMRC